jgi:predicted DNA repair protein MutK
LAGGSLLVLLDDIAAILDDVSLMTKVAARKTAGVLGDDLALNAEQVTGVKADRELPVVWAVAKGSFRNKLILVPAALLISAVSPPAVTALLMLGGLYLCYEGFEKIAHKFLHSAEEDAQHHAELTEHLVDNSVDVVQAEKDKIRGAIRTDFILSAEIIVITLGTVVDASLAVQVSVVSAIAVLMTIGVYGLVAAIVKLDDAGIHLTQVTSGGGWGAFQRWLGLRLLDFAPWLMKALAVIGTAAMFLVGGGILVHGLPLVDGYIVAVAESIAGLPAVGSFMGVLVHPLLAAFFGILAGGVAVLLMPPCLFLWRRVSNLFRNSP